jgi:hypothetical protein
MARRQQSWRGVGLKRVGGLLTHLGPLSKTRADGACTRACQQRLRPAMFASYTSELTVPDTRPLPLDPSDDLQFVLCGGHGPRGS